MSIDRRKDPLEDRARALCLATGQIRTLEPQRPAAIAVSPHGVCSGRLPKKR